MKQVYFSNILNIKTKYSLFTEELKNILDRHGVSYGFLDKTKDIWARDYMPIIRHDGKCVRYIYDPDYLKFKKYESIRTCPKEATEFLDQEKIIDIDINLDGGNIVIHKDKLICTDKLFTANKSTHTKESIKNTLKNKLQVEEIIVITAVPEDTYGHADGMVRFINENKVLVAPMIKDDKNKEELLIRELEKAGLEVVLLPEESINKKNRWAPQINYLKINNLLLVPYIDSINESVIKVFKEQYPECDIEFIESNLIINSGGALNCISWSKFD